MRLFLSTNRFVLSLRARIESSVRRPTFDPRGELIATLEGSPARDLRFGDVIVRRDESARA